MYINSVMCRKIPDLFCKTISMRFDHRHMALTKVRIVTNIHEQSRTVTNSCLHLQHIVACFCNIYDTIFVFLHLFYNLLYIHFYALSRGFIAENSRNKSKTWPRIVANGGTSATHSHK